MSKKISFEEARPWLKTVPLRGYIVDRNDDEIRIKDKEATWIVCTEDVVAIEEWEGVGDLEGEPCLLRIRDEAELLEVRPTRIKIGRDPLTLSDVLRNGPVPAVVKGNAELDSLARQLARHLGFAPGESANHPAMSTTVCCYDTGEWGMDCEGDDCG